MEPMISRIDHVSIAVRDYEKAEKFFRSLLGGIPGAVAEDPNTKYLWQLFSLGDLSRLELMKATAPGSFLDGFLSEREGGVHHITLQTPDIAATRRILERQGIPYFGYNEYQGSYWKELFIHPRHAFGVLIQIAEFTASDWLSQSVQLGQGRKWDVEKTGETLELSVSHPGGGRVRLALSRDEAKQLITALEEQLSAS